MSIKVKALNGMVIIMDYVPKGLRPDSSLDAHTVTGLLDIA